MAGVTASLALHFEARLTGAALGGDVPMFTALVDREVEYEPGTDGVNKANVLYHKAHVLANGANTDIDLAGALADALGVTIAAAEITAIIVEAADDNDADVSWGPKATASALLCFGDASDREKTRAGDWTAKSCRTGWTVTATSADSLNFANGDFTLTLLGRTVAA